MEKIVLVLLLLLAGSVHVFWIAARNGYKPRNSTSAKTVGGIGLVCVVGSVVIGWLLTFYAVSGAACGNADGCGGGWLVLLGAIILVPVFIVGEILVLATAVNTEDDWGHGNASQ